MGDNPPPSRPCAICGKPQSDGFRPFCSERCQDVDLNRWLSGRYSIPTDEAPENNPPSSGKDDD